MQTIWNYLDSKGILNEPREEKKVVHLALESEKINPTQLKRMRELSYLSKKLDGVYSFVTYIKGEVRHWGRSGKALSNCEGLDKDLKDILDSVDTGAIVLISEITSDDPLAKLSGYLTPARVNDTLFTPTNMKDNFHDYLSLNDFIAGSSEYTFKSRQRALESLRGLPVVPQRLCTYKVAQAIAAEWIKEGYEGGVYAQDSLWISGARNETLMKIKERISYDVTVVGVCSGKKGTKYKKTLGKLLVVFRVFGDSSGKPVVIPISGMTDRQRDAWWDNPSLIIGKCVRMDAKSFTETGNLREPRFKEVRHDKPSDFPVILGDSPTKSHRAQAERLVWDWS
jgi:ATP-dependent DNA ligase